ncbi:hypothetical protein ACHAQD_009234, partial [Fusarium lateritium]
SIVETVYGLVEGIIASLALSGRPVFPDELNSQQPDNDSAWAREDTTCDGDEVDPSRGPGLRKITATEIQGLVTVEERYAIFNMQHNRDPSTD